MEKVLIENPRPHMPYFFHEILNLRKVGKSRIKGKYSYLWHKDRHCQGNDSIEMRSGSSKMFFLVCGGKTYKM
ncbi:MAG: hypothetical protein ACLRH0_05325 [Blautia wexlerae]